LRVADVTGTVNRYVINCNSVYTAWRQTVAKRMTLSLVEYSHIHIWVNTGMRGGAVLVLMKKQRPLKKLTFSWISFILPVSCNCPVLHVFY